MLNMKDFEGIKRIDNSKDYDIDFIYKTLINYENEIGKISLSEENKIIADVDGKYIIEISLTENQILIQRKLEPNFEKEDINLGIDLKSIDMSKADRMIEQIYDLIITLKNDGSVNESITGVKKVLFAKQEEGFFKNLFYIQDESGKNIYEIKENKILKEFTLINISSKRKNISIRYTGVELGKYNIVTNSYTTININKDSSSLKTLFTGEINNKKLTVTADYSDNHYIVEYNNIVIGAIDSLNDKEKNHYRLEINNLDYEYLIICLTIIIDLNSEKQK